MSREQLANVNSRTPKRILAQEPEVRSVPSPKLGARSSQLPLPSNTHPASALWSRRPHVPRLLYARLRPLPRLPTRTTIQRRAGARQRCILRACALQQLFYLSQLGILRKDDAFEVVLDPGSDEVEKRCLGPVPAKCGNTGCRPNLYPTKSKSGTCRGPCLRKTLAQPGKHTRAELVYCTCGISAGQCGLGLSGWGSKRRVCTRDQRVPLRESLGRRDPNRRRDHDDVRHGKSGSG